MLDYGKQDLNVFCSYSNGSPHLPRTLSSHERTFSMSALDSANQHFSHDICQQMLCFDLYLKVLCNSDKVVSRACRVHLCFILGVFFHTYIRYVSRQWIVIRVLLLNTIPDSEGANQHQGWSHWPSCSSTSFYISTYRLPYPFVPTKTMAGSLKTWRESYKTIGFFLDLLQSIHINAGSPRYPVWIHLLWKNPCSDIEFNFPKQCYQSCLICLEVYQGAIPVETFFLKQGKNGGNFKEPFSVRT